MASLCVTAEVPDPKLARAGLAPFSHAPRDGVTSTSASGEPQGRWQLLLGGAARPSSSQPPLAVQSHSSAFAHCTVLYYYRCLALQAS